MRLELILLGVLLERPRTGYELQRFMDSTGRFLRSNTSMTQVYRSLRRMEADGWLAHEVEPRLGARDAKRHHVTAEGAAAFHAWLREPYHPSDLPGGQDLSVHLRFRAAHLGRDAVIELLDAELAFRRRQIARDRDRDRTEWYEPGSSIDAALTGALMNWQHARGASRMDDHVAACAELRDVLAAGGVPHPDQPNPLRPVDAPDPTGPGLSEVP
ncbi:MAG: PadR family transcriptional regulator [Actinomycetota bacterium]|nr:PadR family transcriptional regulator [Actinomycetota bacterium]